MSDSGFILGKNSKVNALKMAVLTKIRSHKDSQPTTIHGFTWKPTTTHEEEKLP